MNQRIRWGKKMSGSIVLLTLSTLVLAASGVGAEEPCGKLPELWFPEPGVVLLGGVTAVQETSGDVCEGGKITITVTIDNLSCGDAGPFDVRATWDDPSRVIQTKRVNDLPACEFVKLTFTWDTDGVPPGPHTIYVVADYANAVAEIDEANNTRTFDVLVRPNTPYVEATKTATDVDGGLPTPGDTIRYDVFITNAGCADLLNGPGHEFVDVLPAGMTSTGFVQASSGAIAVVGDTVTWDGAIPAGGEVRLTFRVRIGDDVPAGTQLCNQGFVQWDNNRDGIVDGSEPTDDPSTPLDDDPTCVTVQESDLPIPLTGTIDAPSLTEWGMGAAMASFAAAFWRRLRARPNRRTGRAS